MMDIEFDKEMDALLRKAASRGVLVGDDAKSHLDADTIAAFAENALPQKSRTIYTQHLAACDPCRMSLANLISINAAAEPAMAAAAAPVPATLTPWYQKFFAAPKLAYVMGGLVLIFGGLFGLFVLQNAFNEQNATVSMIEPEQARQEAPARGEAANSTNSANSNANTSSISMGEIPQSVGLSDQDLPEENLAAAPPPSVSSSAANPGDLAFAKPADLDSASRDKALAGQPAAAPAKEEPKREETDRTKNEARAAAEQETRKQDNSVNLYSNQQNQTQMTPGAGNKATGPSRVDLQRDNRGYDARQMNELPVQGRTAEAHAAKSKDETAAPSTRVVSGKTFEMKQGVWYDTAYSGQVTKNIKRGTEEFRKLDSGLRNIANSMSGTVVVIWKGKPYRIQ